MDVRWIVSQSLAIGFICIAVVMDVHRKKISNRLILLGLAVAFLFRMIADGSLGIIPYLINITVPVLMFFLFFLFGAIGAGDIKLFSLIGGFISFQQLGMCITASLIAGAVLSLIHLLRYKHIKARLLEGILYIQTVVLGEYKVYEIDRKDDSRVIHFSIAIFMGFLYSCARTWRCL